MTSLAPNWGQRIGDFFSAQFDIPSHHALLSITIGQAIKEGKMKTDRLIWIPRVLAIILIVFLSLFALDAFSGDASFIKKLGGFLRHLIPTFILVLTLLISRKKPLLGGSIFILLSIAFSFFFKTYRSVPTFLAITFPVALVGILFIAFDLAAKKKRKGRIKA
jgi:uncharacterized membrane protein YwzB